MTSHMIDQFARRNPNSNTLVSDCVFCEIISGQSPCYKVYETDQVIAILDIQPIRHGHALVMPKTHVEKISDLPPELASAVGAAVSRVAGAICRGLNITALNVVANQEYAQAVSHVHYHIVPAPSLSGDKGPDNMTSPEDTSILMQEWLRRGELDESSGYHLSERIKSRL
ncbi:Protein hit OS=Bacillus subtilis (strain 168) GN=hit PE=1 SV=1 [Rhizoctonia solani AG-1 IB]|uniref:Protein hit n=1 Tax=Thanatephorus cucumeris (strain AG1-IB / isolate 7/3/14) TaxID=1108050 RepID=A0A0B7G1U5_THACB|nr:Protein hit OS=Bacillus subtilis (strain 168) GN=hit PE=1 SV=1 [Rhizoctonia solani AG-1 IB]